jgi:[protein-PII] uridylyltransferase
VDNDSSSFFPLSRWSPSTFHGLLFRITDTLFKCGLDIWVAKIATNVDQVVDVFYVRDFDGQKVDAPHQVDAVKPPILDILPGEDSGMADRQVGDLWNSKTHGI